jgi:hypothetical protein
VSTESNLDHQSMAAFFHHYIWKDKTSNIFFSSNICHQPAEDKNVLQLINEQAILYQSFLFMYINESLRH